MLQTKYQSLDKIDDRLLKANRLMIILIVINSIIILTLGVILCLVGKNIATVIDKGTTFFDSSNKLIKKELPNQFQFYQQLFKSQNETITNVENIISSTLDQFDHIMNQYEHDNMTEKIVQITDNLNRITNELNMTFIENVLYGIKVDLDKIVQKIG